MKLIEVLAKTEYEVVNGEVADKDVSDIVYDSRRANEGNIFVCLVGAAADGHAFVDKAYEQGCRIFLVQKDVELPEDATVVKVADTRATLAVISDNFFGHPSGELKLVGITGTKGKTTTTYIIKSVLDSCGVKAGLIGTVGATWGDETVPTVNTTPESYETQKILRQMVDDGVEVCAMEVSSLGVKHHRVDCLSFFCGVFTNISPDHIGGAEHADFEEYYSFKKKFFEMCDTAVGCIDDDATVDMISDAKNKLYYGTSDKADYIASNLAPTCDDTYLGVAFDFAKSGKDEGRYEISIPGKFSVLNALAALAVVDQIGVKLQKAKGALMQISVPGRAQVIPTDGRFSIVIDYAHNGLALESLVTTIKDYGFKRIIALYGSVGDRAQLRREELGRASARLCDFTYITSDDPGFEDPMKICDEIGEFMLDENSEAKFVKIPDREEAVIKAIDELQDGDILLLCGKGPETAQKVKGEKVPYSEMVSVSKGLELRLEREESNDNYTFKIEEDLEAFDKFVTANKGAYQQCSVWPNIKSSWTPYFYSGFKGKERVLTALVLERKLPLAGKLWYIPCGALCDYNNKALQASFTEFIRGKMKKHGAFCVITDPLVPLRIDGEEQPEGVKAHNNFTKLGYKLNTDLDSYTYKHPVQTMIPLKDEAGNERMAEQILKGCEKGVRYSVRVGVSRGLYSKRYRYEDMQKDPKIIEDFMSVMGDTSDRNSFVNRGPDYIDTLVKNLDAYTDISIVYYDKEYDRRLEEERQARKIEVLKELTTAPQKKQHALQEEIDTIDKNTKNFNARMEETADYPGDAKIAVAGGLTIRYGGIASCVFGGTRDIVRNNTRSSHFLNYFRIRESCEEGMDFHDLGYVLCDNPNPPTMENGTLGKLEPRENFVGIRDFKLSFGAKYYEFIGEYILVGNGFKYWIYKELMPMAKKIKMSIVKLLRRKK